VRKHQLGAVLLLACLFAQTLAHARSASITFDEGPHLAIGYATLRTGDLRLQPVHIHPPLANVLAAAPLLFQTDLPDPRSVGGWEIASLSAVTDALVWQYPHPRRLAMASRFPIIVMTTLLGAVIFRWASDLFGSRAGLVALFLCAFDPNVIAHGSLVTTDMAVVLWGTAAFFLIARYLRRASFSWRYWTGVGVMVGAALASKVSAVSLLPAIGLLCLLGPRSLSWRRRFLALAGCLILAFLVLWAAYGFEVRRLPEFQVVLPAATHLAIYRSLQEHYQLGHPSFLMGQNSDHGWWYYFPIAFLLKTPLATLVLLATSTGFTLHTLIKSQISNRKSQIADWGPLALFPLFYVASSFFSSVNIGYRHLLPILPFTFIFASQITKCRLRIANPTSRITYHVSRITYHVSRIAYYVLLSYHLISTLLLSPYYLTYFSPLVGGPANGYRYLVDSNLDWGQNMLQLRDWMQENQVDKIYYAHFSPDRPQVYGVRADFLPPDPRAVPFAMFDPAPGFYAIGVTVLQGVYTPDVNTYAWFRSHDPLTRLGNALFIYRVPSRPRPTWAVICTNPTPALSRGAVLRGFDRPDMRVILLDCAQSWVFSSRSQEEPVRYVLHPEAEPPPGAVLEVAARHPDGSPLYNIYDIGTEAVPQRLVEGFTLDGPAAFLGYELDDTESQPGETVELRTFWRVEDTPGRPFSLMAHLLGPDEQVIAVGDGLGAPIDQWQLGDVIVQRHQLLVPEGTATGDYQIQAGAYWLDTMERWAVHMDDGSTSDRILLGAVTILQ
jgi:hypothetical protein